MGLHLHRKLTAVIVALFMLVSFQAPAAFGAESEEPVEQNSQQVEETTAPAVEDGEPEDSAAEEPAAQTNTESDDVEASEKPESSGTEKAEGETAEPESAADKSEEEAAGSEKKATQSIEIFFRLSVDPSDRGGDWVKETAVSIPEGSTAKDAIKSILEEIDSECNFDDEGAISSITVKNDSGIITLPAEDTDSSAKWICRINGKDYEDGIDQYELKEKDYVLVYFEEATEETVEETVDDAVTEPEIKTDEQEEEIEFRILANTTAGTNVDNAYGNTKDVVANIGTSSNWSEDSVWLVMGLARAGALTSNQGEAYYNNILAKLESTGSPMLNSKQSSHNSRAILALTAAGYDVTDIGGYNLLEPLANMAYIKAQGVNGPIWALLAFDSKGYDVPQLTGVSETVAEKFQTSREKLIQSILDSRKNDGGWAYSGKTSDVDMTAMAIQALAPYYNVNPEVKTAVDGALVWLSSAQNSDGSFSSSGYVNSESSSQVIVALTSLGIDPAKDKRFLKNGKSAVDSLMSFYTKGGGFKHIKENFKYNVLATYQGYYALVAYYRNINGKNTLYDMSDAGDDFVIDVDYIIEKPDNNNENGGDNSNNSNTNNQKQQGKNTEQQKQKKEEPKALGATKGLTKSAGLIKLKGGATAEAKNSMGLIEEVVKRGLSEDASTYTEDDIKAINEAYRAYLDLQPAEKLAVEKDKNWKPFCKLTAALGKIYHIDKDNGVDVLDNNDIIMPWYVRLVVREKDITSDQSKKITGILGENSQIFGTFDISFTNTLEIDENGEETEWHPADILKVNMGVPDSLENNPIIIHINGKDKIEFLDNKVVNDEDNRYEFYDKYAQFQSDDFSVYGMASTSGSIKTMISRQEEEAPSTSYLLWIYIGLAALAALALIMILRRRAGQSEVTGK